MIDFRYHIISLVAVFLALGIGIVVGTTVVDRSVVTRLESQVSSLNEEVKSERQNRRLAEDDLKVWDSFAGQGAKFFVGGRLKGRTVMVVFPQGLSSDDVEAVTTVMRQAGASVPATVQLTDKLNLRDQTARDQLALATGAPDTETSTLYTAFAANMAVKLGSAPVPPAGETGSVVTPEVQATLLSRLEDAGFIEVRRVDTTGGSVDTITGQNPMSTMYGLNPDQTPVPYTDVILPLTLDLAQGGRTVAVQRSGEDQVFMRDIRSDAQASAKMSTVDDIQHPIGEFAAVLSLEQAPDGVFGAYGTGPSAQSLLPERVTK